MFPEQVTSTWAYLNRKKAARLACVLYSATKATNYEVGSIDVASSRACIHPVGEIVLLRYACSCDVMRKPTTGHPATLLACGVATQTQNLYRPCPSTAYCVESETRLLCYLRFKAKQDSAPLRRFVEISGDQHAESPHGAGVCVAASVAPCDFALPVYPTAG
ncbi:hypothetical protein M0657_008789 [Pyricularia oryzae]|nr:hypothetical protein M0657_008789 [Pyricularia oryzae]KAI7926261.1 hypothetical protein M9X92_002851 [Pyricularia oryzae]